MILFEGLEDIAYLQKIAAFMYEARDIELLFVSEQAMREINKNTRGLDKSTDVLAFPLENTPQNQLLGSIVINKELALKNAKLYEHSLEAELSLLFIHALLHLLGYDHEKDEGLMREEEEKIILSFKLPKSLILRNT